jgi:hypothetical protein
MKNKKNKKYCGPFAVRMRTAKDHLVTLPCAYARQRAHVALACEPWELVGALPTVFAVRDGPEHTAKLTASRTAMKVHGNGSTLGNDAAHGKGNEAHGNEPTLGNGVDARRRHSARQSG